MKNGKMKGIMAMGLILSLFLVINGFSQTIKAADTITWMVFEWPPWQYYDKEAKVHKGYAIEWQRMLEEKLVKYQHKTTTYPDSRMIKKLKDGDKVCAFATHKSPERDEFVHYSFPVAATLNLVVFMRESTFEKIGRPSELSMEEILKEPVGTALNPAADPVTSKYIGRKNLIHIKSANPNESMFRMLAVKRLTYVLDYLVEGRELYKTLNMEEPIKSVILTETKDLWIGYAVCPKNSWGESVINDINTHLSQLVRSEKYRSVYERYLDKSMLPYFRKAYQEKIIDMK